MKLISQLFIAATASTFSLAALAHGDVKCDAPPKAEWGKQIDLQNKLVAEGWKVRQVKQENDCYEVYGTDEKGTRVEAFFNPKTFVRVTPPAKPAASAKPAAPAAAATPATPAPK